MISRLLHHLLEQKHHVINVLNFLVDKACRRREMVLKYLYTTVYNYFYTLLHLFDPVKNIRSTLDYQKNDHQTIFWSQRMNSQDSEEDKPLKQSAFLGPAFCLFLLELVGIFGLHIDGYRTLVVKLTALSSSPYIFIHQAMPREVWPQMEAFFAISINGGIFVALALASKWATPLLSDSYRLVVEKVGGHSRSIESCPNRKGTRKVKVHKSKITGPRFRLISKLRAQHRSWEVGEKSSALILTYRSTVHKYFYIAHAIFVAEMSTQYIMVYMNGAFQWSFISVFFWVFIFPSSIFHAVFVFYGVPIIMTLFVVVILVQQLEAIETVRRLNSQLAVMQSRASSTEVRRQRLLLEKVKMDYSKVNKATVQLDSAISAYSRQWTAYLSTALPVQTVGVAYVAYVFFFGSRLPMTIRNLFGVADSAVALTIFTQLNLCAQVVRNGGLYVRQTELFVRRLHALKKLSTAEQLKLVQSTTQERKEFAFRFLDDNTLNPSTFPMIFTYCTICILMIAKKT